MTKRDLQTRPPKKWPSTSSTTQSCAAVFGAKSFPQDGRGRHFLRSWYCSWFTRWHCWFWNSKYLLPESVLCWLSMKSHFVSSRPLSAFRLQGHCGAEGNPSLIELRGVPKDTNKRKWERGRLGGAFELEEPSPDFCLLKLVP